MPKYVYRIHPAVGIARMGNSQHAWFPTGEVPGEKFNPRQEVIPGKDPTKIGTGIRDKTTDKRLAKQGARFRVFCYEYEEIMRPMPFMPNAVSMLEPYPRRVWECTVDDYDIDWEVQVANLKSKTSGGTQKPNQPDAVTLSAAVGAAAAPTPFTGKPAGRLQLGSCFVDSDGHLVVLGSEGAQQKIPGSSGTPNPGSLHWANWEDDAADGPVRATIKPKNGSNLPDAAEPTTAADGAWVIIGVPDYGADLRASVTLYDIALNHGIEHSFAPGSSAYKQARQDVGTYRNQILSIEQAYYSVAYSGNGHRGTSMGKNPFDDPSIKNPNKAYFEAWLRPPRVTSNLVPESIWANIEPGSPHVHDPGVGEKMPNLEHLGPTELQVETMKRWSANTISRAGNSILSILTGSFGKEVVYSLDRAHLEQMSGGSFYPGIEVGREAYFFRSWEARPGAFSEHMDVRIRFEVHTSGPKTGKIKGPPAKLAKAGYLTATLACPWQSDFVACSIIYWPHSRPVEVRTSPGGAWQKWMSDSAGDLPDHRPAGSSFDKDWWKLGFVRYDASKELLEKERVAGFGHTAV